MAEINEKELNNILEIDKTSFKYFYNEEKFKNKLKEFEIFHFKENDKIICYLLYKIENDKILLRRIAVAPDFRRKGYATKMFKEIREIGKKLNLKTIYLYVRVSNKNGQKFQEKLGFVKKDIKKNYFPDGEDAYLMEVKI